MATEIFDFPVQTRPVGTITFNIRRVSFGDGYEQRVGNGLNNKKQAWSISFEGSYVEALEVTDFLDRHGGHVSFQWTKPGHAFASYFVCDGYTEVPHVGAQKTIQATFYEVFQP